ncbi:MAG: carboxypeptidase-like regulatory domain-containing protein, partial [Candidatus Acidiferrum sp.]
MSRLWKIVVVVIFAATSLKAQTPDAASIRGQVADQSHAALSGVDVTVTNRLNGAERTTQTDSSGNFSFSGLPIGKYTMIAHKQDFADVTREITLTGGTTADIELQLGLTAVKEEIVVTGAAGEIRTDEPQLGDRLGQEQLQEMPLPNSRITYLPLLNAANRPAINQGDVFMNQDLFTTNGSGRRQTAWVVDGITAND